MGDDRDLDELLHYSYTSSSGATGFGTTIGGCGTAPTCIYVDVSDPGNENLRFRISKSSGGNTINELEVTGLDNNDDEPLTWGARMAIPTTFNEIPHDDVLFYVYLNAWYQYKFEGCRRQIRPLWLHLYSIDGTGGLVDSTVSIGDKSTSSFGFAFDKNAANGEDILICINLFTFPWSDGEYFKVIV